ncbi:MAG: nucleotidyltransferase domain-containing protein [Sphingomicrobium sp.]
MQSSPEFALVLECCRWNFASARQAAISTDADLDWAGFLRLVRFHRVQGLVSAALAHAPVPRDIASLLSADAKEVAASNLKAAAECARIQHNFEKAEVDVLFFKGLTLSALAYRDPFIKMSSDIDILVDRNAIGPASSILRQMGYRSVVPSADMVEAIVSWHARNKESAWLNGESGAYVELHGALANNARLIPSIGMASSRQWVEIGRDLALPTLDTDDLLAYLFIHGASSAWFRLKWLSDVCALLDRLGAERIELAYRHAIAKKAGRAPAQALLLGERLFGLPLTAWTRAEIRRDGTSRLLARAALRAMSTTDEPTGRFGGTLLFHMTQPLLLEGWSFAMNETSRQVRDVARRRLRIG